MPRQFHRVAGRWKNSWRHRILKKAPSMDRRRAGLVYVKRNGPAIPADPTVPTKVHTSPIRQVGLAHCGARRCWTEGFETFKFQHAGLNIKVQNYQLQASSTTASHTQRT